MSAADFQVDRWRGTFLDRVHTEGTWTGHSGLSPFTEINRALPRLIPDVYLCERFSTPVPSGLRVCVFECACVCGPGMITHVLRQNKSALCLFGRHRGHKLVRKFWFLMFLRKQEKAQNLVRDFSYILPWNSELQFQLSCCRWKCLIRPWILC